MANTYTQIYLHIIFSPFGRDNLLHKQHKEEIHKYITGIIQNRNHKLLSINSMPDHLHILIGYNPAQALPNLLRDIKTGSSNFINGHKWMPGKFQWQEGYGAFSYSRSQIDKVINYINNQEIHHKKQSFREEYLELLKIFNIAYNEQYLFQYYDDSTGRS
ncbi:MAG: IS200/IS605 family transposase [Bacteroidota bacterium]